MMLVKVAIVFIFSLIPYGITETYNDVKDALPEKPHYDDVMGKYLNYPGLRYEPNVDSSKDLVHIVKSRFSSYEQYIDRMDLVLSEYTNQKQTGSDFIDCRIFSEYRSADTWDNICRFDLVNLGAMCTKFTNYGYEDGQPCITLSLERILNWLPEPYTNETVPDKIRDEWSMYAVTVHCEGEDPVSKDNIGDIQYYPKEGFHFMYFPFKGQENWKTPVVAVRLENPTPAVAIRVTCSAYAKNMRYYDILNTGKVSFDVLVD